MDELCLFIGGVLDGTKRRVQSYVTKIQAKEANPFPVFASVELKTETYQAEILRSAEGHNFKIFRLKTLTSTDVLQMMIDGYSERSELKKQIEKEQY